jgi:hypothetical protein
MRIAGSVLVGTLGVLTAAAGAVGPRSAPRLVADTLTALPAASVTKPLRAQRDVRWSHPPTAAWQKLAATGSWHAAWDRATGVPNRIWGAGLPAPGAVASPDVAAAFARAMLGEHIALLAPGATPADFELVSNTLADGMRSVGFLQKRGGVFVIGGQLSFRFKNDRLFVIGSEALPDVALPPQPRARMVTADLVDRATASLRSALALPDAPVAPPGDEVILPLVGDDAVLGYRLAVPMTIDGGADGRYLAYCDPTTGEPLAVRQMNLYASGTLLYRAVERYPAMPRKDKPAPIVHVKLNGRPQTTTRDGEVDWADDDSSTVATSVVGDLVAVVNKGSSVVTATAQLSLAPGGSVVWDASATPEDDAQIQSYLNVNIAKDRARVLDPDMPTLDEQITANVNIGQECNAFFDGRSVNFFRASSNCQNTGLIQDVVFHEYGHAIHTAEIVTGVGAFDGAMSEGAADFFAAQITGDSGVGRGFFYSDKPLRELDPPDSEARWPQDIGEIHKTGMIFGGAFWDLRKALIDELHDEDQGAAATRKIYLGTLRTSTSIPTSLIEALAADDDDGDLDNGTPHECAIRNAYARHGLRTVTGVVGAPDRLGQVTRSASIHIDLSGLTTRCTGDDIDHTEIDWHAPGGDPANDAKVMAVRSDIDPNTFFATLPVVADDKVLYQIKVVFADSSVMTLPDNRADPYYQLYEGKTIPLYCEDFESGDPMANGWTGGAEGSVAQWSWGVPAGGATDPHAAYSTSHVMAQVLNGDYPAKSYTFLKMPPIDVGRWSDVHLQYRRWLSVEDSHFDQARIMVGGLQAWMNSTQNTGDSSTAHHIDREWRFHDVELSGLQAGHVLDISWDLRSDEGVEFGGWAIDDVCVVANTAAVCGDGVISAHEACDDGTANADLRNACRTWCQKPSCGDRIVDDGEECDGGPAGDADCTSSCRLIGPPDLGGCCSTGRGAGGSCALAALVLGLLLRRRTSY